MDGNSEIKLDPDVICNGTGGETDGGSPVPLSALYGFRVFGTDIEQKVKEHQTQEEDTRRQIRQEVFTADDEAEGEMLERIHVQVFQVTQAMTVDAVKKETEMVTGIGNLPGWQVITGLILFLGLQRLGCLLPACNRNT